MTTFLLLLKCFFQSILSTLLRVVLPSVTILLLKFCFKILFTPLGMRLPSSEVTITHSKKSEVRIANKQISHLHPLNKANGSARSDFHSFNQDSRSTAEYT